ncbi:MAG TPA: tetratricopeptide repeat protein [Planctomycetes bacterium]|nr:tetratricopeptide repeat protein [Planctomycetota bacterium]
MGSKFGGRRLPQEQGLVVDTDKSLELDQLLGGGEGKAQGRFSREEKRKDAGFFYDDGLDGDFMEESEEMLEGNARDSKSFRPGFLSGASLAPTSPAPRKKALRRRYQPGSPSPSMGGQLFAFPSLGEAPEPEEELAPNPEWPTGLAGLLGMYSKKQQLQSVSAALRIEEESMDLHPLTQRRRDRRGSLLIRAGKAWYLRRWAEGELPREDWVREGRRVAFTRALGLARSRKAGPGDVLPLFSQDGSLVDLPRYFHDFDAKIETKDDRNIVTFTRPFPSEEQHILVLDRKKKCIRSWTRRLGGEVDWTMSYGDFQEAGGLWWAGSARMQDKKGRLIRSFRRKVKSGDLAGELARRSTLPEKAFVLPHKLRWIEARQHAFEGKARPDELWLLLARERSRQAKDKALRLWASLQDFLSTRPAKPWLEVSLFASWRDHAALRDVLLRQAARIVSQEPDARLALAQGLLRIARSFLTLEDWGKLLDLWEKEGDLMGSESFRLFVDGQRLSWYQLKGSDDQVLRKSAEMSQRMPGDFELAFMHMGYVLQFQGLDAVLPLYQDWASGEKPLLSSERRRLFLRWFQGLKAQRDLVGMQEMAGLWASVDPESWEAKRIQHELPFYQGFADRELGWARRILESPNLPPKKERADLWAACRLLLGMGIFQRRERVEAGDWEVVAQVLLRALREDHKLPALLQELQRDWRFRRSPAWKLLQTEMKAELGDPVFVREARASTLAAYLGFVQVGTAVEDQKVVRAIRGRWEKTHGSARAYLGDWLDRHLKGKKAKKELLEAWAGRCSDVEKADVLGRLLELRLKDPWSQEVYGDVVGYAVRIFGALESERSKVAQGPRVVAQVSRGLLASWKKALLGPVAKLEKLPRKERRRREREADQKARRGLAERFLILGGQGLKFLRPWFTLEGLRYSVESGLRLGEACDQALALLASEWDLPEALKSVLTRSLSLVASYAAVRRDSPREIAPKVDAFFAARAKPRLLPPAKGLDWRVERFRLLVALDLPAKIQTALKQWTLPASVEGRWFQARGLFAAEAGRFDEAVRSFEAARLRDSLSVNGLKTLSVWYLVLGREEARVAARREAFAHQSASQLYSNLYSLRYNRKKEITPEIIEASEILMQKAPSPSSYIWFFQSLYANRKDTRLLRAIPFGIPGHGPRTIYPYLRQVANMLQRVKREAAFDELRKTTRLAGARCQKPWEKRGMAFLRGLIETRASYVKNQPEIAGKSAEPFLDRAMQGSWFPGEPLLAAQFLASLGRGQYAPLAEFRKRSVRKLWAMAEKGSAAWLNLAQTVSTVYANLGDSATSVDILQGAIEVRRRTLRSFLPTSEQGALWSLVGRLQGMHRFYEAEGQLQKEMELHPDKKGRNQLQRRIFQCRLGALLQKARVRPGSGRSLYRFLRKELLTRLSNPAEKTYPYFQDFCNLHSRAARAGVLSEAASDLIAFSKNWKTFRSDLLYEDPRWTRTLSNALENAKRRRASLAFLVRAILEEPEWYREVGLEGWVHHSWRIAWLRYKIGTLSPSLAADLLKVVKRELERDLLTMSSRSRYLYYARGSYFWAAKKSAFREIALKVLELYGDREDIRLYTARYLWTGLGARDEAVAALEFSLKKGKLSRSGRGTLVSWLTELKRYAKALPLIEGLLREDPKRLDWRLLKLQVLAGLNRRDEARAYLGSLVAWMREAKLWHPAQVRNLAYRLEDGGLLAEASTYLEKAIRLYERSRKRSDYWTGETYERWAKLLVKLGEHQKAYQAASAALLSFANPGWRNRRRQAQNVLRFVLQRHPDLKAVAKAHEAEVAKTGEDVPLLRKTLGEIFFARREYELAARQWEAARELDPLDKQNYDRLVNLYRITGDSRAQIRVLMERLKEFPRDKKQYAQLASLLRGLGQTAMAARAKASPEDL